MKTVEIIPELSCSSVALGHFDGLHLGHRAVISSAVEGKPQGGRSVVLSIGGGYKEHTDELKYRKCAIVTEAERVGLLERWGVDVALTPPFETIRNMSGEEFVRDILKAKLGAELVCCGFNYRFGKGASCGCGELIELCGKYGIECKIAAPVRLDGEMISSTSIRIALQNGDIAAASAMLGRRYGYTLPVRHGNGIGRKLGTPTINQIFPDYVLIPRYGVYASRTLVGGRELRSVTNIGVKPTLGENDPQSETWILDFSGDLYEESIRVELLEFLRPEMKFDSMEKLREQIEKDAARV